MRSMQLGLRLVDGRKEPGDKEGKMVWQLVARVRDQLHLNSASQVFL
jgi:hypothetical protein